jgi:hypothetical protein
LPPRAKACPECGSDETTGWSEEARYDGLNLPDEDFDHDDFVKREFGGDSPVPRGIHWVWWLTAILLIAGFVLIALR